MPTGISYSKELAEAAKQYASNPKRMTIEQYDILRRFGGGERNYYKLSAEILLNLLEGAETHSHQAINH